MAVNACLQASKLIKTNVIATQPWEPCLHSGTRTNKNRYGKVVVSFSQTQFEGNVYLPWQFRELPTGRFRKKEEVASETVKVNQHLTQPMSDWKETKTCVSLCGLIFQEDLGKVFPPSRLGAWRVNNQRPPTVSCQRVNRGHALISETAVRQTNSDWFGKTSAHLWRRSLKHAKNAIT